MGGFIASPAGSQLPFNPRREPNCQPPTSPARPIIALRLVAVAAASPRLAVPRHVPSRLVSAAASPVRRHFVSPRHASSRLITPRHAAPRHCLVTSHLTIPRRVTPCLATPCLVTRHRHRSSWATKTENNTDADPTRRFTFVRECKAKACFADAPGGRFVPTVFGGPGLYGVHRPNRL